MEAIANWPAFLGRSVVASEPELAAAAVAGRVVLITGAGGSIGSGLARAALAGRPGKLVLLDSSEGALYECHRSLSAALDSSAMEIVPVTGSVGDSRFLSYLFGQHRPEVIFHTAAYKHVPLMERNPFSAIANNSIGTYKLVSAALEARVSRLVAVSTDKAVNPLSIMGASKRIGELAVLAHSTNATRMNAVRLCNVLGSSGSVAAIFREQAETGLPLTVSDAEAERYFLAPAEAVAAILRAAVAEVSGRILLPDCGAPFRIIDLARHLALRCGSGSGLGIEFTGLRPGDKLREELLGSDEIVEAELANGISVLVSPCPSTEELSSSMGRLAMAVENFDSPGLSAAVRELVPSYWRLAGGLPKMEIAETTDPSTPRIWRSAEDDQSLEDPGAR